jgi:predicted component of type VI protein secretion system
MKKNFSFVLILLIFLSFISGCSSVVNTERVYIDLKGKNVIVVPFENYTETPLAGLRVASITYGVVASKGYKVNIYNLKEDKDLKPEEIKTLIDKAKDENYDFAITGSVNEFRYKTGIDGEPAVSITVKIYDLKNDKVVYSAVGSKTGWSHESLTTVSQKILNKLVP